MPNLPDFLAAHAEQAPDNLAIDAIGVAAVSYAILERDTRKAAGLIARHCAPGERMASVCRNRLGIYELLIGCARAGAVLVPLDPDADADALRPLLQQCAPRLVVHDAANAAAVHEAAQGLGAVLINMDNQGEDGFHDHMNRAAPTPGRASWPAEETWYQTGGVEVTYGAAFERAKAGPAEALSDLPAFVPGALERQALPALIAGRPLIVLPRPDPAARARLADEGRLAQAAP